MTPRCFKEQLRGLLLICVSSMFFLLPGSMLFAQGSESDPPDSDLFITRGRGFLNLTFSLDQKNAENENQLVREVIDQDKLDYRVTMAGGYAIKNNFTLGLGLSYGRQKEDITFINESGEEQTNRSLGQDMSFIPNFRKYIPLNKGNFQVFVQTDLRFTFGESLERRFYTSEVDKIENEFIEIRLGVTPGLVLFFTRNWALETSVGLVGLSSKWSEETINNDIENRTKIAENNLDLRINLLSLNLGVAYYF